MSNNRVFVLQKDLPNVDAGTDFLWDTETGMYKSLITDIFCKHTYYHKLVVESDDGTWFIEKKEQPKDEWVWTDELVEQCMIYDEDKSKNTYAESIQQFKQSKSTPKPKVEVTSFKYEANSDHGRWYKFHIASAPDLPWPEIVPEKYEDIKKAIEYVLNDDNKSFSERPVFTPKQHEELKLKAMEEAFNAAREGKTFFAYEQEILSKGCLYKTFDEYVQSLKNKNNTK